MQKSDLDIETADIGQMQHRLTQMISGYFPILAIARLVIFCEKCAVRSLSTIVASELCSASVSARDVDRERGRSHYQ